jgi:hypothetical protein
MCVLRRITCSAGETAWRKKLDVRVSWTTWTRRTGVAEESAENGTTLAGAVEHIISHRF